MEKIYESFQPFISKGVILSGIVHCNLYHIYVVIFTTYITHITQRQLLTFLVCYFFVVVYIFYLHVTNVSYYLCYYMLCITIRTGHIIFIS